MSMAQVKTGLVSVTFRQKSVEEIAALTAEAGLSGVEWGGDVHGLPGDREAARRAAVCLNTKLIRRGACAPRSMPYNET